MIKQLVMKINDFEDAWEGSDDESLCTDGVREYFHVPEGTKEILLCASDKPVRGATEGRLGMGLGCNLGCCTSLSFEGKNPMIVADMAVWFPDGDFWFWIEY